MRKYLWDAMVTFAKNEPLTESELDRLGQFLSSCPSGKAMNVEHLDGFFAALVAGPDVVMPSEYMPEIFGSETPETHAFSTLAEANEILALLMRHWNEIARTLAEGKVHFPVLLEDENGVAHGNDWAHGFMRGTLLRHDGWAELLNDEDHGGCMIPMLMLAHEHDEDPAMRPKPIGPERREEVITSMMAGLVEAYVYFRGSANPRSKSHSDKTKQVRSKIGRNNLCPCGSGKKYKRCCGSMIVH